MRPALPLLAIALAAAVSACGAPGLRPAIPVPSLANLRRGIGSNPIKHVVIVMQENRSFDNFFYDFPGANGATYGMGHGVKYPLRPFKLADPQQDPIHSHWQFLEDLDRGKNDGFDRQIYAFATAPPECAKEPENQPSCWIYHKEKEWVPLAYTYVPQNQIQPYWDMAEQYTLGDETFSSNNGESFPSHEYMIAGQSGHATEAPSLNAAWGCDAPYEWEYYLEFGAAQPPAFGKNVGHEVGYKTGPDPCFPLNGKPSSAYPTIADLLDNAGVTWRYYVQPRRQTKFGLDSWWLNAFDAVKAVRYGPDWHNDIAMPDTKILSDIANGRLQQVSWVMPHKGASDHAGGGSGPCGPNWVASIVNAIGQSPYWKSTAIIVMWDEWGGWYDHVKPPQYEDPRTHAYEGLGYRVPLIVVSPYAKAHYISHRQHEVASTLHYIEQTFNLPPLGQGSGYTYADSRADAFDDVFDYTQKPIAFKTIKLVPGLPHDCKSARDFLTHEFEPEEDY